MAVPDGQQALRLGASSQAQRLATSAPPKKANPASAGFFLAARGVSAQPYNLLITWVSAKP